MHTEDKLKIDPEELKEATRKAVEQGANIKNNVHDLTLKILTQGHLDIEKLKQVIHAVMEGASIGADVKGGNVKDSLRDAMSGMDDALAKSAQASKLAIEETAGRVKDFNNHDLKRALDDLLTLEKLFFDSTREVASGASEMVKEILSDLIKHAQQSGTSVGKITSEAVTSLNQKLGNTLKDSTSATSNATIEVGVHIANAAAGILEGIAESLQSKSKNKSSHSS